jgi:hypothetical protein
VTVGWLVAVRLLLLLGLAAQLLPAQLPPSSTHRYNILSKCSNTVATVLFVRHFGLPKAAFDALTIAHSNRLEVSKGWDLSWDKPAGKVALANCWLRSRSLVGTSCTTTSWSWKQYKKPLSAGTGQAAFLEVDVTSQIGAIVSKPATTITSIVT